MKGPFRTLALAAAAVGTPTAAGSQPPLQITPSIAATQVYDDNIFYSASRAHADAITRMTPAIEVRYDRPLVSVDGHYRFDVERYANTPALDTMSGRRDAAVAFRSRQIPRVVFGADAAAASTNTPSELNAAVGLATSRAHASRTMIQPFLERAIDSRTTASVRYSYVHNRLEQGADARTHSVRATIERRRSARVSLHATYGLDRYGFDTRVTTTAQVATAGVRLEGRSSSVELEAGPRLTAGRLAPELSLAAHRALKTTTIGLSYTSTQTTLFGIADAADARTLAAAAAQNIGRRMQLRGAPAVSRIAHAGQNGWVFRLPIEASTLITDRLTMVAGYEVGWQSVGPAAARVARRAVSVSLKAAPPSRRR